MISQTVSLNGTIFREANEDTARGDCPSAGREYASRTKSRRDTDGPSIQCVNPAGTNILGLPAATVVSIPRSCQIAEAVQEWTTERPGKPIPE